MLEYFPQALHVFPQNIFFFIIELYQGVLWLFVLPLKHLNFEDAYTKAVQWTGLPINICRVSPEDTKNFSESPAVLLVINTFATNSYNNLRLS